MSTITAVRPQLVGPAELVRLLGVSRTRYVQIISDPRFPEPFAELTMGKVWDLADITAWAEGTGRTLHSLAE
jgi:predicted DNA-binding transcriptional regulator AlpA